MEKFKFDEVLDAVDALDPESQEELVSIIQRRLAERGRRRVIAQVRQARKDLAAGNFRESTAEELFREIIS